jgi:peptidoglycan-associated lipoprotein
MIRARQLIQVVAICAVIAVVAAACTRRVAPPPPAPPPPPPPVAVAPPPPPPPPPPPAAKPAPPPAPLTEDQIFARKSLEQINSERPLGDVYFDLDQSTIRADARSPLQANATWMKRWATTQVTVEGHCDSRGSAEYNLALGTRRAEAVKQYLVDLGIPATRIVVVSKGKEQPFCTQENESCWQENRRGHYIVTAK